MRDFKTLEVWSEGHQIVLKIYAITQQFPPSEQFGIVLQMRRSAASIPTNIAEGCGRGSNRELKRFCEIAMGSASELEYLLILSNELQYLESAEFAIISNRLISLKKRLNVFIQYLGKMESN